MDAESSNQPSGARPDSAAQPIPMDTVNGQQKRSRPNNKWKSEGGSKKSKWDNGKSRHNQDKRSAKQSQPERSQGNEEYVF